MSYAAHDLAIGYGGRALIAGIDLAVEPGGILCVLGPNGAGKTTLFRTLLGLMPAVGGAILVDGQPLSRLPRAELARHLSHVPQAHSAVFSFTVLDIVLMGRTAHLGPFTSPGPRDREAALNALRALGIADLADALYTAISGGQRQLVLIARALAQDTRYVVMDEPTASLDFGNQVLVLKTIRALARERGKGVVLSTHDPDHVLAVADRAAVLGEGRVLACGTPAEVVTAERLSSVYSVPIDVETATSGARICVPRLD